MNVTNPSNIQPTTGVHRPAAFAASGPTPALTVKSRNTLSTTEKFRVSYFVDLFKNFQPECLVHYAERTGLDYRYIMKNSEFTPTHIRNLLKLIQREDEYFYLENNLPLSIEYFDEYLEIDLAFRKSESPRIDYSTAPEMLEVLPDYLQLSFLHTIWTSMECDQDEYSPIILAATLKALHCRPRAESLVVANFGVSEAEAMFDTAADGIEGFYLDGDTGRSIFDDWVSHRVYRGGNCDPDELETGMSWSLSIEEARGYSRRGILGDGPGVVLATDAPREDVLGVFDYEHEVVLRPRSRQYEIVEYVTS